MRLLCQHGTRCFFFFSSRRRHTRWTGDWSSDVCSSDLELTGGIRDDGSLRAALATGAARVNIGTAAIENPGWTDRVGAAHGERVAIALDVRGGTLSGHGWTRDGG